MVRYIKENIEDDFDNMFDFGEGQWVVNVPKECIKGATLLSEEEYEKYKENIPQIEWYWWLRSGNNYDGRACYVRYDGSISDDYDSDRTDSGIRPALILNFKSSNLNFDVGDKIDFGGYFFIIISNSLAICDDFIDNGCFRKNWDVPDANNYEKSDVKRVVDKWFDEAYRNYEG